MNAPACTYFLSGTLRSCSECDRWQVACWGMDWSPAWLDWRRYIYTVYINGWRVDSSRCRIGLKFRWHMYCSVGRRNLGVRVSTFAEHCTDRIACFWDCFTINEWTIIPLLEQCILRTLQWPTIRILFVRLVVHTWSYLFSVSSVIIYDRLCSSQIVFVGLFTSTNNGELRWCSSMQKTISIFRVDASCWKLFVALVTVLTTNCILRLSCV